MGQKGPHLILHYGHSQLPRRLLPLLARPQLWAKHLCRPELVEGPRNRSQSHILITAWVGTPPAPEEASHPQSPLICGQGRETPSLLRALLGGTQKALTAVCGGLSVTPRAAPGDSGAGGPLSTLVLTCLRPGTRVNSESDG